jgi:NAD(P)H-hydrate epimerase
MFLTRDQSRQLDRRAIDELGIPGIVLMENAGRGMAELLLSLGISGRVVVCCGKGNNGGDGMVIARHLANAGVAARVLLFADPASLPADARTNFTIVERMSAHDANQLPAHGGLSLATFPDDFDDAVLETELAAAEWIVDALFGSGLRGAVPDPFDRVIAAINADPARVLAVDIPSGLDSDTGHPTGPVIRAGHTATVAAPKNGFRESDAAEWLGQVHVIDLFTGSEITAPPTGTLKWLLEDLTKESPEGSTSLGGRAQSTSPGG